MNNGNRSSLDSNVCSPLLGDVLGAAWALGVAFLWKFFDSFGDAVVHQAKPNIDRAAVGLVDRLKARRFVGKPFRVIFAKKPEPAVDTIVPAPFQGHDYTEDVFQGIRWRWEWNASNPAEPKPLNLRTFCVKESCRPELLKTPDGSAFKRKTVFTCPTCGNMLEMRGPWPFIVEQMSKLIEWNRRTSQRGESNLPGLRIANS